MAELGFEYRLVLESLFLITVVKIKKKNEFRYLLRNHPQMKNIGAQEYINGMFIYVHITVL